MEPYFKFHENYFGSVPKNDWSCSANCKTTNERLTTTFTDIVGLGLLFYKTEKKKKETSKNIFGVLYCFVLTS